MMSPQGRGFPFLGEERAGTHNLQLTSAAAAGEGRLRLRLRLRLRWGLRAADQNSGGISGEALHWPRMYPREHSQTQP
jgi:hypothetical protein